MRALDLASQGYKPSEIATASGASKGAVSHWLAAAHRGGPEALRSHPSPGAPRKLTDDQLRLIPDLLSHGAEAYGFRGEAWTCERVAGVIYQEFGATYSTSQVSRLLKRLQWTPQDPSANCGKGTTAERGHHYRGKGTSLILRTAERGHH